MIPHNFPSPSIQIIGHGLAGAILTETLSEAGLRVSVFDDGGTSSSQVAAGMFTPITGRRLIPSWSLEQALPAVNQFYPTLEKQLGTSFFHPLSTVRIFRNEKEQTEWKQKRDKGFTKALNTGELPFQSPFGACEIVGGGWVDLPCMLEGLKQRRLQKKEWGEFESPDITIWAEGVRAADNPLWKDVGWRNAQGDILTLKIPGLPEDRIYNFGKFLVPLGNQTFRCGATYAWDETSPEPRKAGREELETVLGSVLTLPYEILDHRAGIRPVAVARVPVAGPHPEDSDQWIFNGFGSKGVLMAPWMAECVLNKILRGEDLPKETQSIRRILRQRDRIKTYKFLRK
ncbi:FAD-dependent oxidoreductase [Kiritimatiellaeota bacterium B1221]|nr:FAD-dependent oxidoreductase [Kiritimatiellaeota bacterium B1221]